ncbi:hypothetical protein Lalb_Chr25g0281061 [Lupinus albus]|uniref:Uncharacterized protein n=1 Tax=Lupinus albus TaxID=3870 RepID=A0A6A4MTX8_LUPAL|nr:hypothetical protein Lalb_Chr25g0281061 [Lupinus albus]
MVPLLKMKVTKNHLDKDLGLGIILQNIMIHLNKDPNIIGVGKSMHVIHIEKEQDMLTTTC